jgi:RNA polymerase sigma-70 factor (ECF subfamily)
MIGTLSVAGLEFPASVGREEGVTNPRAGDSPVVSSIDLVARAQAGDADALNDLCARYLPRLHRWAHGRLPASARGMLDTHDLVQDTLTRVVNNLGHFEPRHEGAFQGYVRQALLNRIRDWGRRQRPAPEVLDSTHVADGPSPLEEAIGQDALSRYETALAQLRPEDREAIVARIELGLTYPEIMEALGKPSIPATHMAVSRALVRLAEGMAHERSR